MLRNHDIYSYIGLIMICIGIMIYIFLYWPNYDKYGNHDIFPYCSNNDIYSHIVLIMIYVFLYWPNHD